VRVCVIAGVVALLASCTAEARAQSPAPVALGGAEAFAVLGASTVTSAGVSTVTGDLGVSPGPDVTGFPPGILHGTMHTSDGVAALAHADLATAYADATGRTPTAAAGVLDGLTLTPGVYASGAALALAGTLTLDAQGDPNAVFILQAGSTLNTAANSHVALVGGAQACNVVWQVGSSATLGASSSLAGTILAFTSISMGDGVTIDGRALTLNAAITLIDDSVTAPQCAGQLTNTAPAIAPFTATLTGVSQTVHTAVGAWSLDDERGTGAGYSVTVSATAPTVGGSATAAGTGAQIILTPVTPTAAPGNTATGPVAATAPQTLSTTTTTIAAAAAGTGQGSWTFPADAGSAKHLAVVLPGDASSGTYRSALTFTTAPAAQP
jgi:hypothetical protein